YLIIARDSFFFKYASFIPISFSQQVTFRYFLTTCPVVRLSALRLNTFSLNRFSLLTKVFSA
ncbi:hypothetical protein, partial [Streptococcus agalactiae]|uniref:hypothetical protein n=1 Tax=Streptococcus agalactiae TaxID=1311 RepID=UPI001C992CE8